MKVTSRQLFKMQCPCLIEHSIIMDNKKEIKNQPIIYFLINGNEIVYVGKSINGFARIYKHITDTSKRFTHYYFYEVPQEYLSMLEKKYIRKYNPKYNTTFNIKKTPEKRYTIDESGKRVFRVKHKHKFHFTPYGSEYRKKIALYK